MTGDDPADPHHRGVVTALGSTAGRCAEPGRARPAGTARRELARQGPGDRWALFHPLRPPLRPPPDRRSSRTPAAAARARRELPCPGSEQPPRPAAAALSPPRSRSGLAL